MSAMEEVDVSSPTPRRPLPPPARRGARHPAPSRAAMVSPLPNDHVLWTEFFSASRLLVPGPGRGVQIYSRAVFHFGKCFAIYFHWAGSRHYVLMGAGRGHRVLTTACRLPLAACRLPLSAGPHPVTFDPSPAPPPLANPHPFSRPSQQKPARP